METKEINGKLYGCEVLPATKGLALQIKLAKFLGGGLGEMRNIDFKKTDDVISTIGRLVENIDDAEFAEFVKNTVMNARKVIDADGEETLLKIDFDKEFSNDMLAMWELFAFVLEVNLGKFISGITSKFKGKFQKQVSES